MEWPRVGTNTPAPPLMTPLIKPPPTYSLDIHFYLLKIQKRSDPESYPTIQMKNLDPTKISGYRCSFRIPPFTFFPGWHLTNILNRIWV